MSCYVYRCRYCFAYAPGPAGDAPPSEAGLLASLGGGNAQAPLRAVHRCGPGLSGVAHLVGVAPAGEVEGEPVVTVLEQARADYEASGGDP